MANPYTREQWQKRRLVKLAKECVMALEQAAGDALRGYPAQAQALRNKAAYLSEVCFVRAGRIARGTW